MNSWDVEVGDAVVRPKIVKDVVHQFVELPEDFFSTCIDTPLIQRLRGIRQLGLAHMVYPGAVHTRFEHSLGVAHTMRRALRSLAESIRIVVVPSIQRAAKTPVAKAHARAVSRFLTALASKLEEYEGEAVTAAILHDVGHIALSHSAEEAFKDKIIDYTPLEASELYPSPRVHHEEITISVAKVLADYYRREAKRGNGGVLDESCVGERARGAGRGRGEGVPCVNVCYNGRQVNMEHVYTIISLAYARGEDSRRRKHEYCRGFSYRVAGLGQERYDEAALEKAAGQAALCLIARLLSHSMDVDRADYILRDSIHSGSTAGIYDINRFYSVLAVTARILGGPGLEGGDFTVAVDLGVLDKGVSVVENMLLSRVYMYSDVYLHDISMIYSAMAARALAIFTIVVLAASRRLRGDIFERHPFLDALKGFLEFTRVREAWRKRGEGYDPVKTYGEAVNLLLEATDYGFEDMIRRIAAGRAGDIIEFLLNYSARGSEHARSWFESMACSLAMLSVSLSWRRHWDALILDETEKTPRIIRGIRGEEYPFLEELKERLSPMVIVSYGRHSAYNPEDEASRIMVFRRSNPLVPEEITRVPHARVVRKIAGETYSKVLIIAPLIHSVGTQPEAWRLRRGKVDKMVIREAARLCGIDPEDLQKKAYHESRQAAELAQRLWSLV